MGARQHHRARPASLDGESAPAGASGSRSRSVSMIRARGRRGRGRLDQGLPRHAVAGLEHQEEAASRASSTSRARSAISGAPWSGRTTPARSDHRSLTSCGGVRGHQPGAERRDPEVRVGVVRRVGQRVGLEQVPLLPEDGGQPGVGAVQRVVDLGDRPVGPFVLPVHTSCGSRRGRRPGTCCARAGRKSGSARPGRPTGGQPRGSDGVAVVVRLGDLRLPGVLVDPLARTTWARAPATTSASMSKWSESS